MQQSVDKGNGRPPSFRTRHDDREWHPERLLPSECSYTLSLSYSISLIFYLSLIIHLSLIIYLSFAALS